MNNNCIRQIDPTTKEVRIFAGSPEEAGFLDGHCVSARFNAPMGIAISPSDTLYIADTGNRRIRAIQILPAVSKVSFLMGRESGEAVGVPPFHSVVDSPHERSRRSHRSRSSRSRKALRSRRSRKTLSRR